jgi:hypothetical protein
MKFKVYNDSFPLVLIRASAVQEIFDQDDLSARQNADQAVLDKYHENWIHNGVILVPSFHIRDNNTRVGMGRHRLTMLSRYMTEIPAAFELEYSSSNTLEKILSTIVLRKIDKFEEFEYPDLPIEDLGTDINGGLDWKRYV